MSERPLTDEIMLAASALGARLFRQNTGVGWVGKLVNKTANLVTLENPRPLRAGLCVGSSDIIGIAPVVVTQDMVGQTIGLFVAVEVKAGAGLSVEQKRFLAMVKSCGGLACVAHKVDDAIDLIKKQAD